MESTANKCFLCGRLAEDANEQGEFRPDAKGRLVCMDCFERWQAETEGAYEPGRESQLAEMEEMSKG